MATRHGSATVTLPSDREILITRVFEAPVGVVWQAITEPRHLLRWWGPTWCPLVECTVDLRVGGDWRYVCRNQDGTELGWHGTYLDIEPGRRIVSTEVFEGFPDAASENTMTLEEVEGGTRLQTRVLHATTESRDGHIASGMETGMQQTFDRLDGLLEVSGTVAERFRRVAGRFTDRANEVPEGSWDAPAPCDGWVARDIVGHLVGWVPAFLSGAEVELPAGPAVADDPAGAWECLADGLQALLDDPAVAGHEFDAGPPGRMSIERAIGMIVLGDVFVHTWDLARAAGLDETLDTDIAAEMLEGMQPIDEMLRQSGHYGPKVDAPADADVVTRLIAFTGRRP